MNARMFPRTQQEAFKHIDPSYGQWWEDHLDEDSLPWWMKLAAIVAALACLAACFP
jgi:hypothetical protein